MAHIPPLVIVGSQPTGSRSCKRYRTHVKEVRRSASPLIQTSFVATLVHMSVPFIRRLVAVFSVLALLLAGFATTSVAANVPCGMDMTAVAAHGGPCDGHGMPDDPEKVPGVAMCFAKCPVPLLDRAAEPPAAVYVASPAQAPRRYSAQVGISIVPLFEPPRA